MSEEISQVDRSWRQTFVKLDQALCVIGPDWLQMQFCSIPGGDVTHQLNRVGHRWSYGNFSKQRKYPCFLSLCVAQREPGAKEAGSRTLPHSHGSTIPERPGAPAEVPQGIFKVVWFLLYGIWRW